MNKSHEHRSELCVIIIRIENKIRGENLKKISILGSTGSIGTQTLDVVRNSEDYKIISLSANSNIDLLYEQILEFSPIMVSVGNEDGKKELLEKLESKNIDIEVFTGIDGMMEIAKDESEILVTSVVGMVGLIPTLEAIKTGKDIALANKETLVTAGEIVMEEARKNNVRIIPVDSEHSAIYQCLNGERREDLDKILITASGGPFRGKDRAFLENVTVKDALDHPNWSMGKKITIDSATLMNKGLEIIEARWLFDIDVEDIVPIVHPQSIIHSMVQYRDGSIIAHLGAADMRIPIQYAITEPVRENNNIKKIDLVEIGKLTFEEPDMETFKAIKLAIDSIKTGGTMPAVLNAANEVLVSLFLDGKIKFLEIADTIEEIMEIHDVQMNPSLENILEADRWAREEVYSRFQ